MEVILTFCQQKALDPQGILNFFFSFFSQEWLKNRPDIIHDGPALSHDISQRCLSTW